MKNKIIMILLFVLSYFSWAQQGINYKAIISDGSGNIISNDQIVVQFSILENATTIYQENHTPTTNENGLIVLNIGAGTPLSGVYSDINWTNNNHFLNVQIDSGGGLQDLGTTGFQAVPYALKATMAEDALSVTGLEALDEGDGIGWRLRGRDISRYGNINDEAVDLSYSAFTSDVNGATGTRSFAAGYNTQASAIYATVFGTGSIADGAAAFAANSNTTASGTASTAFGTNSVASGSRSFAAGRSALAESYQSFAFGNYSLGGGNPTATVLTDPLFVIGNGTSQVTRANAVTILKNGNVGIGTISPSELLQVSGRIRFAGLETLEDGGANEIASRADLRPTENGIYDLGTSSARWGTVFATNGTINTSDRRDKTIINLLDYGLQEILELKPVRFNWKNSFLEDDKIGLIAQDLLEVIPEVVKTHSSEFISDESEERQLVPMDRLGVYYSDLIPVLIKAIQEQQEIINIEKEKGALREAKLSEKELVITKLENRIQKLETAFQQFQIDN